MGQITGPALMCEFVYNDTPHRLIWASVRAGYKEEKTLYLIEKQEQDGMGDPRWVRDWEFRDPEADKGNNRHGMLLRLVEKLILDARPELAAAHRLGGWPAVSAILRGEPGPADETARFLGTKAPARSGLPDL